MSEENEEIIRRGYDLFNARDWEAIKALVEADIEFETRFTSLSGRTYRGHAGVDEWRAEVAESWEDMQQTPERFIEVDAERTVAVVRVRARGKASGVQIDQEIATTCTIRDGKLARLEAHATLAEALEAAGLSE